MKEWLISVAAVFIITSCAEMLLPTGKVKNACRTVLAIVCLAVMIKPLAYISDCTFEFPDLSYSAIDAAYVEDTNEYLGRIYASEAIKLLEHKGVDVEECVVKCRLENGNAVIENIFVKLKKSVISGEDEHIISNVEITSVLCSAFNIPSEKVCIYGN